jgi:predicted nucleic acid-binding protein
MRIFLDANILFSAAKSNGAIRRFLDLLLEAGHEMWVDAYVVEEARRNLSAKSPEGLAVLERLLRRTQGAGTTYADPVPEVAASLPEKDRPVLAAAIHHRCAVLVTGDRTHFGHLFGKTIRGVTVHSPRSLAESILD